MKSELKRLYTLLVLDLRKQELKQFLKEAPTELDEQEIISELTGDGVYLTDLDDTKSQLIEDLFDEDLFYKMAGPYASQLEKQLEKQFATEDDD